MCLRHNAARWNSYSERSSIIDEFSSIITSRLVWIKRPVKKMLLLGPWSRSHQEALSQPGRELTQIWPYLPALTSSTENSVECIIIAEPWALPLKNGSFDCIAVSLFLQIGSLLDLSLANFQSSLTENGFFLANSFANNSFWELKEVLLEIENDLSGQAHPRVHPFVDPLSLTEQMRAAGFKDSVIDIESLQVRYESFQSFLSEIRFSGGTCALNKRFRGLTHPKLFDAAEKLYKERHGHPQGGIVATIELITMIGWS